MRSVPKIIEVVFDLTYLLFAAILGIVLLIAGGGRIVPTLYGAMALTLFAGDACHLIPRVAAHITGDAPRFQTYLGGGKFAASVTMTVFYVLLYFVWAAYFGRGSLGYLAAVLLLAAIRIALCLFPQNAWRSNRSVWKWSLIRNIPFAALGILTVVLYAMTAERASPFTWMSLAVSLSFAFYLPVALAADRCPKLGMLMLPKTVMYIWILAMGCALL